MIKNIKIVFLFCIVSTSLFLVGCWDYIDAEKRSMVIAVGVDKNSNNVEFSGEIATFTKSGEQGKPSKSKIYSDLSKGNNFEAARIDFNSKRPYPTFLGTTRVVVFGKKHATQGITSYINRINKMYDYRKTILAVVSREPAKEILKVKPPNDISAGFLIEHNIDYLSNMGYGLYTDIGQILSYVAMGDEGYVLPYIGIEQGSIKYLGLAVMKGSKLIDIIDTKETDGLLYILAKKNALTEEIYSKKNDKNIYSFKTEESKKKIKTKYKNGKIIIDINLYLKEGLQYQYYDTPINDSKTKELENRLEQKVKKDVSKMVKKTQEEYKCDIFKFVKHFKAQNPSDYKKINWKEKYPNAEVKVTVKAKISNKNLTDTRKEHGHTKK